MSEWFFIDEMYSRVASWIIRDEENGHGVIIVDKILHKIDITDIVPDDFERDISPEEFIELAEAMNQMKREAGESNIGEISTESEHSIYYGDHAVRGIIKHLQKGEVPQKGMQMWY